MDNLVDERDYGQKLSKPLGVLRGLEESGDLVLAESVIAGKATTILVKRSEANELILEVG